MSRIWIEIDCSEHYPVYSCSRATPEAVLEAKGKPGRAWLFHVDRRLLARYKKAEREWSKVQDKLSELARPPAPPTQQPGEPTPIYMPETTDA